MNKLHALVDVVLEYYYLYCKCIARSPHKARNLFLLHMTRILIRTTNCIQRSTSLDR